MSNKSVDAPRIAITVAIIGAIAAIIASILQPLVASWLDTPQSSNTTNASSSASVTPVANAQQNAIGLNTPSITPTANAPQSTSTVNAQQGVAGGATPNPPVVSPVPSVPPVEASPDAVKISIVTGDTKAEWLHNVTNRFNAAQVKNAAGKPVYVEVVDLSSGDAKLAILNNEITPTIWSPTERSWVEEANVVWRDRTSRPLVSEACPVSVYSPIGFAMWRPMAEAMGWPDTPIGWNEIVELSADPQGWARYGHPEWGQLKFGHAHPDYSNSGFLMMASLAYATLDRTSGLTPELVKSEQVVEAFREIESRTFHYGLGARELLTLMANRGPSYLHAATTSEAAVLKANVAFKDQAQFPFVFVFPADGTFWADNPVCILETDWVTDEQREAAQMYREFLLQPAQQAVTLDSGLRPADATIALRSPITLDNGTDPRVTPDNLPTLESVPAAAATAVKEVFHATKKKATVVIVLDTSGSMAGDKLANAIAATNNFIRRFGPEDELVAYSFNTTVNELQPSGRLADVEEELIQTISSLYADRDTALHDAVCQAVERANALRTADEQAGERRLYGVVVLSDGQDTASIKTENDMFNCLPSGQEVEGVKVFTIAYGEDANKDVLLRIANRTNGKTFSSDPKNIEDVYLAISAEQ
jgi:Ca-activated chloride channel family protein